MIDDAPIGENPIDPESGKFTPAWSLWFASLKSNITSYQFDNVLEVYSGSFTNNSPSAGYVAWSQIKIKYNGIKYAVSTNGNTDKKYIYWEPATFRVLSSSDLLPSFSQYLVLIGVNESGTFTPGDYSFQARVLAGLNPDGTVADNKAVTDSLDDEAATSAKLATENVEDYHLDVGAVQGDAGDPSAVDFNISPADSNAHDLDLSSIVPAGYRAVLLHVTLQGGSAAPTIHFRKKGNTNWLNAAQLSAVSGGAVLGRGDLIISMDANRVIEYKVDDYLLSTVTITVGNWFR